MANYGAYITQLPNYAFYAQYHGRPPLHPQVLFQLQRQIAEAKADLRRDIDQDWKACVLRYPEVLAHYYSLINIHLPRAFDPPVLSGLVPPPAPAPPPPAQQPNNAATAAAAAAAGGVPTGFHMGSNGLGGMGVGIPSVGMAPLQRPTPSRAASNGKKSSQASKRMSKEERAVEYDLWKQLYMKDGATPGLASAAGTTHQTRRRNSVRSAPVPPPEAPMTPMYPGKRP